jgi:translation initiation factor IF-3
LNKSVIKINQPKQFQQSEKHRINNSIKAKEVRVIGEKGEQIGIKSIREALMLAQEADLDLVEVAPDASPPVCKLIDYSKFKYQLQKKEAEAKKNRTDNAAKELKIRYCTDKGDLDTKLRQARKFLTDGYKVKLSMAFKGREREFINLGKEKFNQIIQQLADVANIEENSSFQGGQLFIMLSPLKKGQGKQAEAQKLVS